MMRALVARELRARGRFFLGMLLLNSCVIWGFLSPSRNVRSVLGMLPINFSYSYSFEYPLMSQSGLLLLLVLSISQMVILAMFQTSSEAKSMVEAFLLHRPVRRSRILTAKVVTAYLILSGSLLLPYLLFTLYTSTPAGHFGPFRWEMAYPGFAHILAGLFFYPVSLWAMISKGRELIPALTNLLAGFPLAYLYANAGWPWFSETILFVVSIFWLTSANRAYQDREL